MTKAEQFIQEHTKRYNNLAHLGDSDGNVWEENTPWLTPDQARRAVEIAREEVYEWLKDNIHTYNGECENDRIAIIENLKQAMKG